MSDEQFEEKKDELRESRIPFVIIRGKDHKRGKQISEIQSLAGEYYIWETPNVKCQDLSKKMTKIGEVGIVIEDTKVWTNSVEVAQRMRDEERRKTWRKQKGIQGKDHRGWSEVMKDGMMREMDRREIGEVNEISEESTSGILIIGEEDDMQVYYVDSNGE